jgi:hypothetical protein
MKKRIISTLSSVSSTCDSFRYCGSVFPQCAIFCRRLISLRNYLLRLMSVQLMSLTVFKTRDVFPQLLLHMISAQLMSLTTSTSIDTIARKVHVITENMSDDNELRAFAMNETILNKEEIPFQ